MASELTVQTLKGPTSGANANKVIIPSGQTLYAPGHVVNVQHYTSGTLSTNSTGDTTLITAAYTPTITGSKLYVSGMSPRYQDNSSTGTWHSSAYLMLNQDGTGVAAFEHVGTSAHSGQSCENVPFDYYSAATTAGVVTTFTLLHRPTANGTSTWYFGRAMPNGGYAYNRMTIMEIAQ